MRHSLPILAVMLLAALPQAALAGPPAICHPFDIGDAKSLPWGDGTGGCPGPSAQHRAPPQA